MKAQLTLPSYQQTEQQDSIPLAHPVVFYYRPLRPLDDFCQYYVNCKKISYDNVEYLLNELKEQNIQTNENECIFYYKQQYNNQFYEILCEVVSPVLVNNCLNKNFGLEIQHHNIEEYLAFKPGQKENLEFYLKQYLSQYLLD